MTLQSLCAAIRSQLYFSQISAWTDLIKNSLEPEIFNNPRIKKVSVDELGASVSAPIPISSSSSSSSSGSHNGGGTSPLVLPKAKLDILFRIRGYDNTACFNDSPNVHNFPDAIIAENYVIEVCLKSLPRLERIPSINDEMDMKMDESLVNDRMDLPCHEKGKHRCAFRDEDEEDPQTGEDDMSPAAVSHREKQLMKYKKRMMKREKKKKSSAPEVTSTASNGSSSSHVEAVPMMVTPPVCKSPALNIPAVNHHASNCSSSSPYTSSINLIQPPLYSNCDDLYQPALCASNNTKATQTAIFLSSMSNSGNNVATVATQTDASGCCCLCAEQQPESDPGHRSTSTNSDSKMQYINSNYNRRDYTSDDCDISHQEVAAVVHDEQSKRHHTEEESKGLRKAELLLQAIQRTAIINDHQQPDVAHFSNNNYYSGSYNDNNNTGSDTAKCERRECDTFTFSKDALDLGDCRLCKRQKTKHNFKLALNKSDSSSCSSSTSSSTNNSPPGCRRTLSESLVGHFTIPSSSPGGDDETDSASYHAHGFDGRHKSHSGKDVGDLSAALSSSAGAVVDSFEQLKKGYRRAFSEDVIDTIDLNGVLGIQGTSSAGIPNDGDGDEDDDDDDGEQEQNDATFSNCECPVSKILIIF